MIVTASERLRRRPKVNMAIFGPFGIGKTFQANTLDPEKTLFVDLEAGTLAIEGWAGDTLSIMDVAKQTGGHPWEVTRALSTMIGGPDPSDITNPRADGQGAYSKEAHAEYVAGFAKLGITPESFDKYDLIYVDSITQASRYALQWAQAQEDAWSDKKDAADMLGAYGLLGREAIQWLCYLQHCPKGVVVVGILNSVTNDFGKTIHTPQIEGAKTAAALPGIFDVVLTLDEFEFEGQEGKHRAFCCHQDNKWGYPAKDRSGTLDTLEKPHLGELIEKIRAGKRTDKAEF